MLLPSFNTPDRILSQLQTQWTSILNPVLSNPSIQTSILKRVALATGINTINHLLGKNLTGWRIVRQRALASIYDQQDGNARPELTLILITDQPVVIDLEVF